MRRLVSGGAYAELNILPTLHLRGHAELKHPTNLHLRGHAELKHATNLRLRGRMLCTYIHTYIHLYYRQFKFSVPHLVSPWLVCPPEIRDAY